MSKLFPGDQSSMRAVAALEKAGFRILRQGAHMILTDGDTSARFRAITRSSIHHGRHCPRCRIELGMISQAALGAPLPNLPVPPFKRLFEHAHELPGVRPVDGPMIEAQAVVLHRPNGNRIAALGIRQHHGSFFSPPMARIADSGWLMIGVPNSPPNTPELVSVNVDPSPLPASASWCARGRPGRPWPRQLHKAPLLGLLHHRHNQPPLQRHRDAQMDVLVVVNRRRPPATR